MGVSKNNRRKHRPSNVLLLRALWSLLDDIWGVLKGSWGVLAIQTISRDLAFYLWSVFYGSQSALFNRLQYALVLGLKTVATGSVDIYMPKLIQGIIPRTGDLIDF